MIILQALNDFYERLDRRGKREGQTLIPPYGFKPANISYILELNFRGEPLSLFPTNPSNEKTQSSGETYMVPGVAFNPNPKPEEGKPEWEDLCFVNRTSGRRSYIFWDKTEYAFGVTKEGSGKKVMSAITPKSKQDHLAFKSAHQKILTGQNPDFLALLLFMEHWRPELWEKMSFPADALGKNIAFRLQGKDSLIHENQEVKSVVEKLLRPSTDIATCLITGRTTYFARKQPQFTGVWGAQSSGASIVSFNADAYESFSKSQGANAPVSERAAFRYGAALNWLLDRSNSRVLRVGESTLVYWADEKEVGEEAAKKVEKAWSEWIDPGDEPERDIDAEQSDVLRTQTGYIASASRAPDTSDLPPETRIHILALSPNAGRIAVRFWLVDTFGHLRDNLLRHEQDLAINPSAFKGKPKAWALLKETAVPRDMKNVPPRLGGEFMQAILTGTRYPRSLLTAIIGWIRADKQIIGPRAALIRAVVNRDIRINQSGKEEIPVSLDLNNDNEAYRLGRLFALIEGVQKAALGGDINATVKDKFFSSASTTPAGIFPLLQKNAIHHLAKLRKEKPGLAHWFEQEIGAVWSGLPPDLKRSLRLEDQGRFIAGYYHQRFAKKSDVPDEAQEILVADTIEETK